MIQPNNQPRLVRLMMLTFSVCTFWAGVVSAIDHVDQQLLDGLRSRGLYGTAIHYCNEQLAVEEIPPRDEAIWTVELIRTHADHGLNLPSTDRQSAWSMAHEATAAYIAANPESPFSVHVRLQGALAEKSKGELLRHESAIAINPQKAIDASRTALRAAIRSLTELERDLPDIIAKFNAAPRDDLSEAELLSVQINTQYHLAHALLQQALTYGANQSDRLLGVDRCLKRLDVPLAQLDERDSLFGDIVLLAAHSHRLLSQVGDAVQVLERVDVDKSPPRLQLRLRAEQIRILLAAKKVAEIQSLSDKRMTIGGVSSPDLFMAWLEVFLHEWKVAEDAMNEEKVRQMQKASLQLVGQIKQRHGSYWGRRAELLLIDVAGQSSTMNNLAIIEKTADDLFKREQLEEAIAAYRAGAVQAEQQEDTQSAFRLYYKAAQVDLSRDETERYLAQLRQLALHIPKHEYSPTLHLIVVQHVLKQVNEQPEARPLLVELLSEHVQHWTQGTTVDQARTWQGLQYQQDQAWDRAVFAYSKVSRDFGQLDKVLKQLEICWVALIEQLDDQTADEQIDRAVEHFAMRVMDIEQWQPGDRQAVLSLASLLIRYKGSYQQALSIINQCAEGSPEPTASWVASSSSLRIVALAATGQQSEANELIEQLGNGEPNRWLDMLEQLTMLASQSSMEITKRIGALQVETIELLSERIDSEDDDFKRRWEFQRAVSLSYAGQTDESIASFKKLATENPKSGVIQRGYGNVLLDSENGEYLKQSILQWRRIAGNTPPESAAWFNAKYNVALGYFKLGQKDECATRIKYLQVTTGLDKAPNKNDFLELLGKSSR